MPKINVYLPDELAEAVRETGVPVSTVCQRSLETAVHRITTIRRTADTDLLSADDDPIGRLGLFTDRCVKVVEFGTGRARAAAAPNVGTADLLGGIVAEGANLALQILAALDIDPSSIDLAAAGAGAEPGGGAGLRFSGPAAAALELTVAEATALGHTYVGTEHLLIGLTAEPDGAAGRLLRAAGADGKSVRRAVVAALTGYRQAQHNAPPRSGALLTAVREELRPLVRRIERLEARLG